MVGALLVRRQRVKDVADRLERGIADVDDVIKRSVLHVPGFRAFPAAELAIEVLHSLFHHIQLAVRRQLLEEFPGLQSLTGVVHHGHVVGENVQILRSTGFAVACLIQKGRIQRHLLVPALALPHIGGPVCQRLRPALCPQRAVGPPDLALVGVRREGQLPVLYGVHDLRNPAFQGGLRAHHRADRLADLFTRCIPLRHRGRPNRSRRLAHLPILPPAGSARTLLQNR